jgi:hypothetical protein
MQLKHLITSSQRRLSLNVHQLCRLAPNIKSIYINWALLPLKGNGINDLSAWRDQLEVLKEPNGHTFAFCLLSSGTWSNLTTLAVDCSFFGNGIFKYLKNAPHLLHLTLIRCQVTFALLEKLHSSLTRLASLTLNAANLPPSGHPVLYRPSTSLTSFSISFHYGGIEGPVKILEYVKKKYTHLSQLGVDYDWREDLSKSHELQIVRDGILPIVRSLGPQLTSLNIGGTIMNPDFFKTLHSLGLYNLKLMISSNFSLFRQFNFTHYDTWKVIRELTIDVMFDSHLESLVYLKRLLVLKLKYRKVFIEYGGLEDLTFDLPDLFGLCPLSLQELQVVGFQIKCTSPPERMLGIKTLEISSAYVHQDVYANIALYLPKLRFLTLKYEYPIEDIISLENLYLSFLSVEVKTNGHIEVVTLVNNQHLYYPLVSQLEQVSLFDDPRTIFEYGSIKNIPKDSLPAPSLIKLTCGSINTLILNRHVAF